MQKHTDAVMNKAIRDGRPRPPRHQCVYQISSWSNWEMTALMNVGYTVTVEKWDLSQFHMGGPILRQYVVSLETITHRPNMPNTKVVGIIFAYILTPIPNLYDHSFPRYGQITLFNLIGDTTDLDLIWPKNIWNIFVSHGVPIRIYVWHSFIYDRYEKWLRYIHYMIYIMLKTRTYTFMYTHTQTDMGITIPSPTIPKHYGGSNVTIPSATHWYQMKECAKNICSLIQLRILQWYINS